jgi:DNA-binding NtrC family response regulator
LKHSLFNRRRRGEVLVVEDEPATREMLAKWIDGAGFAVSTAADAESALDILATRDIAVVTIDKDMPGRGGMWLVAEIQKRHPTVAMLLASGDGAIPPNISLSQGVLEYLVKPFDPEAVVRGIVVGTRWHDDASKENR